jgi:heat shock protein HslJ
MITPGGGISPLALLPAAVLLLWGCAAPSGSVGELKGTATYQERMAPPAGAPAAMLENTYWKLVRLGDTPVSAPERQREAHLLLHSDTWRVSGSGGCNRLTGAYWVRGEELVFGRVARTMMACKEGMETERAFLDAFRRVRKARMLGQQLELLDSDDNAVARFEAVYPR